MSQSISKSALKRFVDFLSGIPMTAVGGVCLAASLGLSLYGVEVAPDPAWGAVLICGLPLLYLALWRVVHNPGISKISSALLITIAMFAAIAIGDLFAAGEVAFIMSVGAILEEATTRRAQKGLGRLISLTPQRARRLSNGNNEEMIPVENIRVGDVLRVLPGEAIPVDGEVVKGESSVDQSIMTGESLPADKAPGDAVLCGTLNLYGSIDVRAARVGEDNSLNKLIRMVREAGERQAPIQRIADRWASWLVPVALLIAIAAWLATGDVVRGVTVLVVFCPCALILATPTAIMAAIGQAAGRGVIIKSGEALERMGKVDTVALDKTGTLTFGRLEVSDVLPLASELDEGGLLALAASAESRSEHPLGRAIVARARELGLDLEEAEDFRMEAGRGVRATVGGREVLCGGERYLTGQGAALPPESESALREMRGRGCASVLVARDGRCLGVIGLSDVMRPEAEAVVSRLAAMGTSTVLLTGDNRAAAEYFAARAGIPTVLSELLPEEKVAELTRLRAEGRTVCMIGDGVNDAPALKAADVGAAMGNAGSDIAVEAADVTLMNDDLSRLPYLKRLANATVGTIKFSLALSLCINFIAIVLSMAGALTPTTGALVHNAGSCLVVLIAALLYERKFEDA